jgi:hypothetical protein
MEAYFLGKLNQASDLPVTEWSTDPRLGLGVLPNSV